MSSHSTVKTAQILGIFFPLLIIYFLSNLSYAVEAQDEKSVTNIGAIIDVNSRIGKQQKAAMEVAAENFNNQSETHELKLLFRDSGRDPFIAAYAGKDKYILHEHDSDHQISMCIIYFCTNGLL